MKVLLVLIVFSAVANSDDLYGRSNRMPEYLRIKRAKYYSNPPNRFYRKPPPPFLTKGAFSYTPPPNYMDTDDSPHPGSFRPKVSTSRRPVNDGLGDDDVNNLVKHLSKQDLDKIIEFAGEKYGSSSHDKYSTSLNRLPDSSENVSIYKAAAQDINSDQHFSLKSPWNEPQTNYEREHSDNNKRPIETERNIYKSVDGVDHTQFTFKGPYANIDNNIHNSPSQAYQSIEVRHPQDQVNGHLGQESPIDEFSVLNGYIQQELNEAASDKVVNTFTDSKMMQEEQLPKPLNLREDFYEASNTNKVANFAAPNSYKLENFGELPLMDYNAKRDTVSSYHVPHYTVVSSSNNPPLPASSYGLSSSSSSSAIKAPPLEPAPPVSAAKEQSDAHLKAIKIWTHRSQGAAYTLHNDGTLSLEKPGRPKSSYGFP